MTDTVGSVVYDARIDTSKMKGDAAETESIASKTGAAVVKTAKLAAIAAGVAVTAAIGKFVIGGGISRLLNIEDAQAKLKGLGHDAASVGQIMDSALKSVKGTAFGLDAAATAAASAVAAGIKPGKDLTRVLSLTGDTATITGRQFNEAGAIINKVLASNRLSMEEVNQLQDAGLPILSMLGKEYGKTALQMREMVSNGEVDSEKFLKAIEKNIGGAALASGNTTRGAWMNMQAAMARVGAAIVKDIIPKVRDAFNSITKWFDENSDKIVSIAKVIGDGIGWIATKIIDLGTGLGKLVGKENIIYILAGAIVAFLVPALWGVASAVGAAMAPFALFIAIGAIIGLTVKAIVDHFGGLEAVVTRVKEVFKTLVDVWNGDTSSEDLSGKMKTLADALERIQNAFYKVRDAVKEAWQWFSNLEPVAKLLENPISTLKDAVSELYNWFTKLSPGMQLLVSPFGFLINNFDSVVTAAKQLGNIFMTWLWPSLKALWSAITDQLLPALGEIWTSIKRLWDSLNPGLMTALKVVGAIIGVVFVALIWILINVLNIVVKAIGFVADAIALVIGWVANIIGWIGTWVATFLDFRDRVHEVMKNFSEGGAAAILWIIEKGKDLIQWFKDLPTTISNAIVDLGKTLYDAGTNLIDGFIEGIKDRFNSVKDTLSELTGKLTDWKGPMTLDKVILQKSGQAVIQGFVKGLESQYSKVQSSLGGLTSSLSVDPSSSRAGVASMESVGSQASSITGGDSKVYNIGTINIASDADGERWLQKLTRDDTITSRGLTPGVQSAT